jgi:hypothetical protein
MHNVHLIKPVIVNNNVEYRLEVPKTPHVCLFPNYARISRVNLTVDMIKINQVC